MNTLLHRWYLLKLPFAPDEQQVQTYLRQYGEKRRFTIEISKESSAIESRRTTNLAIYGALGRHSDAFLRELKQIAVTGSFYTESKILYLEMVLYHGVDERDIHEWTPRFLKYLYAMQESELL